MMNFFPCFVVPFFSARSLAVVVLFYETQPSYHYVQILFSSINGGCRFFSTSRFKDTAGSQRD